MSSVGTSTTETSELDSGKSAQLASARAVMQALLKGIKQISLYRHADEKYADFLRSTHQALTHYFEAFGTLQLKVELTNFTLHGAELLTESNPLSYRFFKDGIRQLLLRPGFTIEALVTFTTIALSDSDKGAEELNAQLWRAQLPHLEYIMVHSFQIDGVDTDAVQVEVEQVVDLLQKRLRSHSADFLRFARVSESDLQLQIEAVEQLRGAVIGGTYANASLKALVQKEIDEEQADRLFPKLVTTIFQVIDDHVDDVSALTDMLVQLLDAMLLHEDFHAINQMVSRLKAVAHKNEVTDSTKRLLDGFLLQMGNSTRLGRIGEILRFSKNKPLGELQKYLQSLKVDSTEPLLELLDKTDSAPARAALIDVLVPFARMIPELFVAKLDSQSPQMVRDAVSILDRADHPDKVKFFKSVLTSSNVSHKLEVMNVIAKSRTVEARSLIALQLTDALPLVRIQAARLLGAFGAERALGDLLRVAQDKRFEKCEPAEQEAFFGCIGATRVPQAFAFFETLLSTKPGLLNRKQVLDKKLHAVVGIAAAMNQSAYDRLHALASDRTQVAEVTKAAAMHAARVLRQLQVAPAEPKAIS
jgi:hypothetical protein